MINSHKTLVSQTIDDVITTISFNRPEAANALNTDMALDIKSFFASISQSECRVIILSGEGKHFCAGADMKERNGMDKRQWQAQHHAFEEALYAIMSCKIPVIAAVNGAAYGGGLELALACDFIYASDTARFALTETTLGIMPGLGGTQSLPRRIGVNLAKELIFLGKPFSAAEAFHWGMVNRLCHPDSLLDDAIACAETISRNAPLSLKAVKSAIDEGIALPINEALQCELTYYDTLLETRDREEGVNAFNEKRKPVFTGE